MGITKMKPLYDKEGKLKGYIDKYTGEEYGYPALTKKKKNPYGTGWLMNSQEALETVAKDKEIKGETYRVLFLICAYLDFENWIDISITNIAKELEIHRQSASRAIKILEEKKIILKGPKKGRSNSFMLNPNFGWKGDGTKLEKYRKEKNEEDIKYLKNKIKNKKTKKLEELSKKFQMTFEELQEIQNELNLIQ